MNMSQLMAHRIDRRVARATLESGNILDEARRSARASPRARSPGTPHASAAGHPKCPLIQSRICVQSCFAMRQVKECHNERNRSGVRAADPEQTRGPGSLESAIHYGEKSGAIDQGRDTSQVTQTAGAGE